MFWNFPVEVYFNSRRNLILFCHRYKLLFIIFWELFIASIPPFFTFPTHCFFLSSLLFSSKPLLSIDCTLPFIHLSTSVLRNLTSWQKGHLPSYARAHTTATLAYFGSLYMTELVLTSGYLFFVSSSALNFPLGITLLL